MSLIRWSFLKKYAKLVSTGDMPEIHQIVADRLALALVPSVRVKPLSDDNRLWIKVLLEGIHQFIITFFLGSWGDNSPQSKA